MLKVFSAKRRRRIDTAGLEVFLPPVFNDDARERCVWLVSLTLAAWSWSKASSSSPGLSF